MIDDVMSFIEERRDEYVERLGGWLRIESISTDEQKRPLMRQAARWVCDLLSDAGLDANIVETARHPCVMAATGSARAAGPTVLVYGHYDVQPVGDPTLWETGPFEARIRDGAVYARGAADDKGQLVAHLFAVEAWMKVARQLPVPVKFLIEGEEEIGSPNLVSVLHAHRDQLACDYVVISDTAKLDADTPAITYGTRGLVYKEIQITGPSRDLHSGSFGGTLLNPCNVLAAILASLKDAEHRVTLPGFYDDVAPLSPAEAAALAALPFDEEAYRRSLGSPALAGEANFGTLERRWTRPTLDVNGLYGGFAGQGSSTIIPAACGAKVSMRIVPNQDPDRISAAFDTAVQAATPDGVRLTLATHACAAPYVCPIESPGMKAAAAAVEAGYGRKPVFIREGGTLPILPQFKRLLGADSLMMGFAVPDCNAHGPNEFLALEDLWAGIRTAAHFLPFLAGSG